MKSTQATTSLMATVTAVSTAFCAVQPASGQTDAAARHATIADVTEITQNLSQPWGLTFLPDGSALVSSRDTGDIRRIDPVTGKHASVGIVPDVVARNDSGLLGLAASPGFAEDRTVFAYLTTATDNRVVALEFAEDLASFEVVRVVLDGIIAGSGHQGGRLAFDSDGALVDGSAHLWCGRNFRLRRGDDRRHVLVGVHRQPPHHLAR